MSSPGVEPGITTALVGPPGCGLSTILRTCNRMTELAPPARVTGHVLLNGQDIYGPGVGVETIRRRVAMIFRDPPAFPLSIAASVGIGWRFRRSNTEPVALVVERSLRQVGLWDEVKDRLDSSALSLHGEQVQRLCLARALAVDPEVLLFDEPAAALYGHEAPAIEDLVRQLHTRYTILVATHDPAQAARLADTVGVVLRGELLAFGPPSRLFSAPQEARVASYLAARPVTDSQA